MAAYVETWNAGGGGGGGGDDDDAVVAHAVVGPEATVATALSAQRPHYALVGKEIQIQVTMACPVEAPGQC